MFIAASLNPDYFNEKINLFVALAPVASTAHISTKSMVFAANHVDKIVKSLVDEKGLYNWFPQVTEGTAAIDALCVILDGLCTKIVDEFVDETIDEVSKFEMALHSNELFDLTRLRNFAKPW